MPVLPTRSCYHEQPQPAHSPKRLKEGGFTDQQAEALAQAEAEFIEQSLATKRDVKELDVGLKRDIEKLRAGVKRDIKELRLRRTALGSGVVSALTLGRTP